MKKRVYDHFPLGAVFFISTDNSFTSSLLIFPVATIFAKGYTVIQKRRIKRNEQIMRKIILASASPRRRELLAAAGVSFKEIGRAHV